MEYRWKAQNKLAEKVIRVIRRLFSKSATTQQIFEKVLARVHRSLKIVLLKMKLGVKTLATNVVISMMSLPWSRIQQQIHTYQLFKKTYRCSLEEIGKEEDKHICCYCASFATLIRLKPIKSEIWTGDFQVAKDLTTQAECNVKISRGCALLRQLLWLITKNALLSFLKRNVWKIESSYLVVLFVVQLFCHLRLLTPLFHKE